MLEHMNLLLLLTAEGLSIKPTEVNISKFEGDDPNSWIRNLKLYFVAARTPIEHKTKLVVSYLRGHVV